MTTLAAALLAVSVLAVTPSAAPDPGQPAVRQAAPDLARHVNPFSGTQPGGPDFGTGGGGGNTFPGAVVPFGMVQWSPDTVANQPGGYYYSDNRIRGFSLTHLSGAGCSAAQDLPFSAAVRRTDRPVAHSCSDGP